MDQREALINVDATDKESIIKRRKFLIKRNKQIARQKEAAAKAEKDRQNHRNKQQIQKPNSESDSEVDNEDQKEKAKDQMIDEQFSQQAMRIQQSQSPAARYIDKPRCLDRQKVQQTRQRSSIEVMDKMKESCEASQSNRESKGTEETMYTIPSKLNAYDNRANSNKPFKTPAISSFSLPNTVYKETTTKQQENDLKILQKCFNLSLERMQQNYEGSVFLQNKDGSNSNTAKNSKNWGEPKISLSGQCQPNLAMSFTDTVHQRMEQHYPYNGTIDSSPHRRGDSIYHKSGAHPKNSYPMSPIGDQISPVKPRTSIGIGRDQINSPLKLCSDEIGKQIKVLRESIQTNQKAKRPLYQQIMSPVKVDGGSFTQFNTNQSQPGQSLLGTPKGSVSIRNSTIQANSMANGSGPYFLSPGHLMSKNDTPQSSSLNQYQYSHPQTQQASPAKQHQFRKQLKLSSAEDTRQDQHKYVLIESAFPQNLDKGEVTLKAVKMSRLVNEQRSSDEQMMTDQQSAVGHQQQYQTLMVSQQPYDSVNGTDLYSRRDGSLSGKMPQVTLSSYHPQQDDITNNNLKLKIITTQIPQSLLNHNNNLRTFESIERLRGDSESVALANTSRNSSQQHVYFAANQPNGNQIIGKNHARKQQLIAQNGKIINGFLVPTKHVKNSASVKGNSMPPSLTAINVTSTQLMQREVNRGGGRFTTTNLQQLSATGAYFSTGNQVSSSSKGAMLPSQQASTSRKFNKKKPSPAEAQLNQVKIARRQIQFYQKRNAERQLPPRTKKQDFCTSRLLFKRRARLADQNLLIFYFDGVVGDLCAKSTQYGQFRIRHGAFQHLRKLSYKYQIALFIPYAKKRSKVIACYIEKFQGCPVDAIYCVTSSYLKNHNDMRFVDYKQILEDFDMNLDERLIEKCLIIAPRTKEVSSFHLQNPSETMQHSWLKQLEKNQCEENEEELNLMQTYLTIPELSNTNRNEVFQFFGCPANLSHMLDPVKKKVNYLHNNEECMSPSQPRRKNTDELSSIAQLKEKQTATQANKIAVDLGQHQKPVTLFVPHTKSAGQSSAINSFQPIAKIIEDLAVLDEHCKVKREQTPLKNMTESFDSATLAPFKESSNGSNRGSVILSQRNLHGSDKAAASCGNSKLSGVQKELQPFSLIDAFYAFKTRIAVKTCGTYASLLKSLFAVETKKVQTFLYKDSMLGRVLLEKAEIKKCYQYTQQKHQGQADKSAETKSTTFIQMKQQNEFLKRYIQDYTQAYYSKVREGMDQAKIMRMTAYFMNQFSQRLVDDQNKMPNQHLREMYQKEINYDQDLPSRNINLFKNHRFLILVKSTGIGGEQEQEESAKTVVQMETVDMSKIMGNAYFRQLDSFRQGSKDKTQAYPQDLLPPDIIKILFNQRQSDCTEWFTKKAFAKPIQLLEKQQMVQERKELLLRGEQEKIDLISTTIGRQQTAYGKSMGDSYPSQAVTPFNKSHTIDNPRNALFQGGRNDGNLKEQVSVTSKRKSEIMSPNLKKPSETHSLQKSQRPLVSRGKTVQIADKYQQH